MTDHPNARWATVAAAPWGSGDARRSQHRLLRTSRTRKAHRSLEQCAGSRRRGSAPRWGRTRTPVRPGTRRQHHAAHPSHHWTAGSWRRWFSAPVWTFWQPTGSGTPLATPNQFGDPRLRLVDIPRVGG